MQDSSKCSDEEGSGEGPFLGAADDGEGEPMGGDEGVEEGHRRYPSNLRQILECYCIHLFPKKIYKILQNKQIIIFEISIPLYSIKKLGLGFHIREEEEEGDGGDGSRSGGKGEGGGVSLELGWGNKRCGDSKFTRRKYC